jgi:hypothetical protein
LAAVPGGSLIFGLGSALAPTLGRQTTRLPPPGSPQSHMSRPAPEVETCSELRLRGRCPRPTSGQHCDLSRTLALQRLAA